MATFYFSPMKDYIKYAITAALISVIAKMTYFLTLSPDDSWDMYIRFFYLLTFLVALFMGLRAYKIAEPLSDFTRDVKTGMKTASVYGLVISAFTFIYYKWVNPAFFAAKIQENVDIAPPELVDSIKANSEFIFSPFTHSTITLFGIMTIGFFYTLVLVLLMRAKPEAFR